VCVHERGRNVKGKGGGDWNEEVRYVSMRPRRKWYTGRGRGNGPGAKSREQVIMIVSIKSAQPTNIPRIPAILPSHIYDPPTFEQKTRVSYHALMCVTAC